MNFLNSNDAVWNDDAVVGALECAACWVKGLPFLQSLSGSWKFFLSSSPENVPANFFDGNFDDSAWDTLPGKIFSFPLAF